jgi:hypothetical protein
MAEQVLMMVDKMEREVISESKTLMPECVDVFSPHYFCWLTENVI